MKLKYNINNIDHNVILCKKKEAHDIRNQFTKIIQIKKF